MQKSQVELELKGTVFSIVEAIRNKKGSKIVDIDIDKISQTVCRHYIICDAQSNNQVRAIAQEIEDQMSNTYSTKPYHKEGVQNGVWILLDFADIIVHIFESEARQFYNLEGLWGDGIVKNYDS